MKNGAGRIRLPDFTLYYKGTVIKIVWYWHKNRHIDQCNRIESPEINPSIFGQHFFIKNMQWGEDSLFNKQCWENWISTCKRMKLNPYFIPYTKSTQNSLKTNLRPETVKLVEENIGRKLLDIGLGNDFLNVTTEAQAKKKIIIIKAKLSCRTTTS